MKQKILVLITFISIGLSSQAQCTITPNCTPSGNGYCTVPTNNATLQPVGEVGVAYSTIIQFNTEATYGGAPINSVSIEATTLPPGLIIEFNPAGNTSAECFIVGGQAGCATISGIPTQSGNQQSVELSLVADVGGTIVPLTANYFIDVNPSTVSISETENNRSFGVSPNPSSGEVQVSVLEPTTIHVYDFSGRLTESFTVNSESHISVNHWESGVYFFTHAETGSVLKFLKQ